VWLLKTLLLITFTLHLLAMNFVLGGGILALALEFRGRTHAYARRLAREMAGMLPVFVSFTVTLGVPPLLFVQALYGNFLYTSSILMAGPWLGVVLLVMLGYYGYYVFALRREEHAGRARRIGVAAALLFAVVAFFYVNNMTLMLAPERWKEIYTADTSGWNLNTGEPTLVPRYLHFLVAAFAMSGLVILLLGARRKREDQAYGRWVVRQGALWFSGATLVQFVVGIWFLLAQPRAVRMLFLGEDALATGLLLAGLLLAFAAIVLFFPSAVEGQTGAPAWAGIAAAVLTVGVMVEMRDIVRNAYLAPHFDVAQLPAAPQWGIIVMFVALFAGGLGTLGWMLRRVARGYAAQRQG
jgi:hypothetical protein